MPEFYPEEVTAKSLELYHEVRAWAEPRGDVTLIGGWAVYELVDPQRAQRSRDLDLVLHTEDTVRTFSAKLYRWGLAWRKKGRTTFKDCHLEDDPERRILVDIFTPEPFAKGLFGLQAATNLKDASGQGFIPSLPYLLRDKVRTLPLREGRDRERKRLKDGLDIGNLVFHNKDGVLPGTLLDAVPEPDQRSAAPIVERLVDGFPDHATPLEDVLAWLSR